jgi:hypothetical protein
MKPGAMFLTPTRRCPFVDQELGRDVAAALSCADGKEVFPGGGPEEAELGEESLL